MEVLKGFAVTIILIIIPLINIDVHILAAQVPMCFKFEVFMFKFVAREVCKDDANDDDARWIKHDCLGSLAFMTNELKAEDFLAKLVIFPFALYHVFLNISLQGNGRTHLTGRNQQKIRHRTNGLSLCISDLR